MYPVTTTIVQNAVEPHQLGTATGALNFARQLGGAIIVAAFGTIVLGGIDAGGHGLTLEMLRGGAQLAGADFATCSAGCSPPARCSSRLGLIAVLVIEERPLRGPRREPGSAAADPAGKSASAVRHRRHSCPAARCALQHRRDSQRDVALQRDSIAGSVSGDEHFPSGRAGAGPRATERPKRRAPRAPRTAGSRAPAPAGRRSRAARGR